MEGGGKRSYPYYVQSTYNSLWTEGERIRSCENIRQDVTARQLTDVYLLALAVHRGGGLATLDSRIDPSQVPGGQQALVLIPH